MARPKVDEEELKVLSCVLVEEEARGRDRIAKLEADIQSLESAEYQFRQMLLAGEVGLGSKGLKLTRAQLSLLRQFLAEVRARPQRLTLRRLVVKVNRNLEHKRGRLNISGYSRV